jgi:hypothetical protein
MITVCPACGHKSSRKPPSSAVAVYVECEKCVLVWAQRVPGKSRSPFIKREEMDLNYEVPPPSPLQGMMWKPLHMGEW